MEVHGVVVVTMNYVTSFQVFYQLLEVPVFATVTDSSQRERVSGFRLSEYLILSKFSKYICIFKLVNFAVTSLMTLQPQYVSKHQTNYVFMVFHSVHRCFPAHGRGMDKALTCLMKRSSPGWSESTHWRTYRLKYNWSLTSSAVHLYPVGVHSCTISWTVWRR